MVSSKWEIWICCLPSVRVWKGTLLIDYLFHSHEKLLLLKFLARYLVVHSEHNKIPENEMLQISNLITLHIGPEGVLY